MSRTIKVKDESNSNYGESYIQSADAFSNVMINWIISLDQSNSEKQYTELWHEYVSQLFISAPLSSKNKLTMSEAASVELPYDVFMKLLEIQPFTLQEFGELLSWKVSDIRKMKKNKIGVERIRTERLIELAQVFAKGQEVFGSQKKLVKWLNTSVPALGKRRPFDLIKTSFGKDLVLDELTRIEHGVFA